MYVLRGRGTDSESDRRVTRRLSERVTARGVPALRVWTPHRQVAFGRRDVATDGYDRAKQLAAESGYAVVEREVGGRAVAYTGETVAFTSVVPNDGEDDITTRYENATALLKRALQSLGATVRDGEPDAAFCPGDHSIRGDGKIAGIAQRVRRETVVVGGCVVVSKSDETAIADVLDPIYDAIDAPFDPDSVGSIEGAGGPADSETVINAIESVFTDGYPTERLEADTIE